MTFIDLFAGVGGFRRGMELAGHKCVGFCEWDKYAAASYTSMHLITEEQRARLAEMPLKQRQKEILKEEYRNGEWYSSDIRGVDGGSIPRADCWCFGAPCQDFSVAGRRAGLEGDRSSLVREVFRILGEIEEADRPRWLIYENVKGMLSSNRGFDYLAILLEMDELGYDIEWQIFNSKDWGVPQNRERVYTIGHLRTAGRAEIFPLKGADGEDNPVGVEPHCIGGFGRKESNGNTQLVYDDYNGNFRSDNLAGTITPNVGNTAERNGQKVVIPITAEDIDTDHAYNQRGVVHSVNGVARTMICSGHEGNEPKVAIPVLTPDRAEKRQNGRRFKEDGEDAFMLTSQDIHGVAIDVKAFYSNTRGPGERYGYAPTLDHNCNVAVFETIDGEEPESKHPGIYVQLAEDCVVYAVWYKKYGCYIAIRKLTPRECFRLQGWTDDYFDRAEFVNTNSQLYKQAGNGVTVDVVYEIGMAMKEENK